MKLVTFRSAAGESIGALHADGFVVDLVSAARETGQSLPPTMQAFIEGGDAALSLARRLIAGPPVVARRPLDAVRLMAPLPRPVRLRDACLFLEHLEASYRKLGRTLVPAFREQVIYYNASHLHVFGPEDEISWPAASKWIDYELEWACVVGRGGSGVSRSDAGNYIFGYTIFNDWSARDLQLPFMETGLGPAGGKDFANSLGPCIVTGDEIEDPYALTMKARINGETWSIGSTASMFHRFEDAIARLSRDAPLAAGEIIGSGTVLNGCGFELDRRLALGDIVELEVSGIGVLRNRVALA